MKKIIAILLYCYIAILLGCQNQKLYKDTRLTMGTFVEVTSPEKGAIQIVFSEIKRIDNLMSKYKENSEIARLNKSGRIKASPEIFYIIKKSKEFWQLTDGAFDITVASLLDLWRFTDKKYIAPGEDEIKKVLRLIGSDKIILNENNNLVELKLPGMKIDLGAIAKGYAVGSAVEKLKKAGIKSCLINAGGQIYCLGDKFGRPWNIAIKDPRKMDFRGYLKLKDKAVSTSGDYEQYFIKENKRYSHIFNPKTGYPVNSGIISVTVIASDSLTADALSTSIFVLGKEKGIELAKKFQDVEVKIIEEKDVK